MKHNAQTRPYDVFMSDILLGLQVDQLAKLLKVEAETTIAESGSNGISPQDLQTKSNM